MLQRRGAALSFRFHLDDPVADDVFNAAPAALLFELLRKGIQIYVILDVERDVPGVPVPHTRRQFGKRIGRVGIEFGVPKMEQLHHGVAKGDKDHVQRLVLPRPDLGYAEGARTDVPFQGVQLLLLEQRVGQHIAVEPSCP